LTIGHSFDLRDLLDFIFFGSSTEWQPPETLDELGASAAQEMLPQHC
jgi:hypothetical protein